MSSENLGSEFGSPGSDWNSGDGTSNFTAAGVVISAKEDLAQGMSWFGGSEVSEAEPFASINLKYD